MRIFPGVKASMGSWDYYIIKMKMSELADTVEFASESYEAKTLNEALQRALNLSRAKGEIVNYLVNQNDRFFSALVIAAVGGNPKWHAVSMEDDDKLALFKGSALEDAFGLLLFDGNEHYYALDGQHRLRAIKDLLDPVSERYADRPEGFSEEEVGVMLVVPQNVETDEEFKVRYRRLFGNLNRYAKPMDKASSIIMDEDDVVAICTRRLMLEHEFFVSTEGGFDSTRVDIQKGTTMTSTSSHFIKIENLYDININLLDSKARRNSGWRYSLSDEFGVTKYDDFKRFRPDDEVIELLYGELASIWSAMVTAVPELRNNPLDMRQHRASGLGPNATEADNDQDSIVRDHLLFWPIGQKMLSVIVRGLLDEIDGEATSRVEALEPLGRISWDLSRDPWRNLLLVPPRAKDGENIDTKTWTMRSEDRKAAVELGQNLIQDMLHNLSTPIDEGELLHLKETWLGLLDPRVEDDSKEAREREARWAAFVENFPS